MTGTNTDFVKAYDRVGIPDPAARGLPPIPLAVELAFAPLSTKVVADVIALLDPLQERQVEGISARAVHKLLGYGRWDNFIRIAIGNNRNQALQVRHYRPIYAELQEVRTRKKSPPVV